MPKPLPIKQRIIAALAGKGPRAYDAVMRDVFPPAQFPNAWRYSSNGGPPGCAMAFGQALRRMGIRESFVTAGHGTLYLSLTDYLAASHSS